jgi:hypothetical protein
MDQVGAHRSTGTSLGLAAALAVGMGLVVVGWASIIVLLLFIIWGS